MARVAVVGAGPAGLAAAVQLARCGHAIDIYEEREPGGALRNARLVENYPGFPGGIEGRLLAGRMESQARRANVRLVNEKVHSISRRGGGFELRAGRFMERYEGAVVCTGTRPKKAGFKGEGAMEKERLIYYEISEIMRPVRSESVCVLGGGEASLDYALSLAGRGAKVTVLLRSPLRAIRALLEEGKGNERISFVQSRLKDVRRSKGGLTVAWEDGIGAFEALLIAVGRERSLPRLVGISPGTIAFRIAGDARRGRLGQVAMAVGDGVEAALAIDRELGGTA